MLVSPSLGPLQSCSSSSHLPSAASASFHGALCRAEGLGGKETPSHRSCQRGQGWCPSLEPPQPHGVLRPSAGTSWLLLQPPGGCVGLVLRLRDVLLEEKMGSAGLPGLESQRWLLRWDVTRTGAPQVLHGGP